MKVLVVGGGGYVGAHVLCALAHAGHELLTVDDLSTGHREAIRWGRFQHLDASNEAGLLSRFEAYRPDAVVLLASRSIVSDSFSDASGHVRANLAIALSVTSCMERCGVSVLVYSSSAAIFGEPSIDIIDENCPAEPISPYGVSKLMIEQLLAERVRAGALRVAALRYFNAAGATLERAIGESHHPETHLIPRLLTAARDSGSNFTLFGDQHPTPDGSCIRDYVHVADIASAHVLALDHLKTNDGFHALNIGSGHGCSVLEVIRSVNRVTGRAVHIDIAPARPFDPPRLVASNKLAGQRLGWAPKITQIDDIVDSAWRWALAPAY